jgi:hypothetical protein
VNIYDLELATIQRIESASPDEVHRLLKDARYPVIFSGLEDDFRFLEKWDLDFFENLDIDVPVQEPEADGVNHFRKYKPVPIREFVNQIRSGTELYIGAREIMKAMGERSDVDGIGDLAEHLKIPPWIDKSLLKSANLWIGAGNNHTVLHFDPWNSILMLGRGNKEFIVIPGDETHNLYPYSPLDFISLYLGKIIHSKVNPLNVQKRYQDKFSQAKGYRGTIGAGDVIFVPAGFWHYVKSTDLNIAVNFFVHTSDCSLHRTEPLRSYWIKDNITLRPVRWIWKLRYRLFSTIRYFFPRKSPAAAK